MALSPTFLKDIIKDYEGRIDKNELRFPEFGMLNQFKKDTMNGGIFSPDDLNALREIQVGRNLEIPTLIYSPGDYTLTAGKPTSFDATYAERTSDKVIPVFNDYWFPITMVWGEHQNNAVKYADKFVRELAAWDKALATQINADCIAAVEAAKTQLIAKDLGANFDGVLDIVNFTSAQKDQVITYLNRMMLSNDYQAPFTSVGNEGVGFIADLLRQRGIANDQNLAVQLRDVAFGTDNAIADFDGTILGTGYFMQDGNTAIVENIARQFRAGLQSSDGRFWSTMKLPVSGIEVNVMYSSKGITPGAPITDAANNPLDLQETWIVWARYSVNTAYNSDQANNASPFIKFDVAV